MKQLLSVTIVLATLALVTPPAFGLDILINSDTFDRDRVEMRMTGLGHTVHALPMASMDATFNYTLYDVLMLNWMDGDVPDIPHLVDAVDANHIGVLFGQAPQSTLTAEALGLLGTGGTFTWQVATLTVIDVGHDVTSGMEPDTETPLGFFYMTEVDGPLGAATTVLAHGPDGPAVVVHDTRKVASIPYYGHEDGHGLENATGMDLTQALLDWVTSAIVSSEDGSWGALKSAYGN